MADRPRYVDQPNYTVKAAAKRLRCSTRTIRRWIRDGMTCRQVAGVIVIDHPVLMARFQRWMTENPRMLHASATPKREQSGVTPL